MNYQKNRTRANSFLFDENFKDLLQISESVQNFRNQNKTSRIKFIILL